MSRPERHERRRPTPRGSGAGRPRVPLADPPRQVAYALLRAVDERDAYANLTLPGLLAERGLSGRDAAFATELAYGTLRGRGRYDAVLAACSDRPPAGIDPPVRDLLRLGTHQLLGMRVPAHAAVSATVTLARTAVGEGPARFVNAVLRRVAERDAEAWLTLVAPEYAADPIGHLSVVHSHPRWVVQAFADALGGDLAEVSAALAADNAPARVTLAARPGRATVEELEALGARPGRWSPYAATLPEGDPHALAPVREGRVGVQDEGSQLVALATAAARVTGPDAHWLDLAAGPGGKAALLAGLAAERGAHLLAVDLHPHRARLVAGAVAAVAGRHLVVAADGTAPAWRPAAFDRVLLDAPCTGLGALRRRPEARWRRAPGDVAVLGRIQHALLAAALDAVRPGGVVLYATCSPHVAETRVAVDDVLRSRDDVTREDVRPLLPGLTGLGPGPDAQLWPHRHGTDAMYLALLRRHGGC